MFDYLQKFDGLPDEIQASVSSPAAMALISDLEKKYQVDLAALVIRVAVKEISLADLPTHLVSELHLAPDNARRLTADLKERLFFSIANYLGYNPSYSAIVPQTKPVSDTFYLIKKVIRESGLNFPGGELNSRLESILNTYFKGVRSRIDTRLALNKGIVSGGLGLDHKIIDNLFLLIDQSREDSNTKAPLVSDAKDEKDSRQALEKVRAVYEQSGAGRDIPYDLNAAIVTRQKIEAASSQKLLVDGDKLGLEAPSLTPLAAPEPETKPVESVSAKSGQQSPLETIVTDQSKQSAPISTPVLAPTPIKQTPTVEPLPTLTPPTKVAPKITVEPLPSVKENLQTIQRPPKKKPNFFQKTLDLFSQPQKETPLPTTAPVAAPAPLSTTSVATLRQQAQQNINNPHLRPTSTPSSKTSPTTPLKPVTRPQTTSTPKTISAPSAPQDSSLLRPKTLGPVEELHYLELVNFRRLGASPKDAAEKIEKKIRTLETDGYDRMVEAILAWRSGEINSIYVKMAKEALKHQITLKQVADKYQAQKNPQYLTWEEIEELIALNHRLSF